MIDTNTRRARPQVAGLCCSLGSWWGEERILVYARYGLSKWVSGRTVMPDVHIVDRETLRPVVEVLGMKSTQLVPRGDVLAEIPVPERERNRFCLRPRQVEEIAKLAKVVETEYGKPVEVEWAYLGETLHVLAEHQAG